MIEPICYRFLTNDVVGDRALEQWVTVLLPLYHERCRLLGLFSGLASEFLPLDSFIRLMAVRFTE